LNDLGPRVVCTPEAAALIRELKEELGPLLFHQSGGCCEGTAPMCFRQSDFRVGPGDILLGTIEGCPFYIGTGTYRYCASSQLIIDVTRGAVDSFSLEAPRGVRFVTRSRLLAAQPLASGHG
jgi:uncharacterized protein